MWQLSELQYSYINSILHRTLCPEIDPFTAGRYNVLFRWTMIREASKYGPHIYKSFILASWPKHSEYNVCCIEFRSLILTYCEGIHDKAFSEYSMGLLNEVEYMLA